VIVTMQLGSATAAAGLANRLLRRPHIVRLTGGGTPQYRSEPVARAASPIGRFVVRLLRPESTTVVAPAVHLIADFCESFPASRIPTGIVRNGVGGPPGNSVRWQDRTGVVWYSRSGTETSTDRFLEIARAAPDVRFTVMGKNYDQTPLGNVHYIGWQSDPESVLGRARILLNTSPNEGMPNMALQALVAGCWVVGPPNQGLTELQTQHPEAVQNRTSELCGRSE
jgi:hypothetical protein